MVSSVGFTLAAEPQALAVNPGSQHKVTQLLQVVIQHWDGSADKSLALTNGEWNSTNVETAFREASSLMPKRLDLRFGIASSLMLQAIQTNGPSLEMKVKAALQVYQEIQGLDPNGFEAPILYAAFARAIGETNASEAAITGLRTLDPQRTDEYVQKFVQADRVLQSTANEEARKTMPDNKRHVIVILGAGLETNGTTKVKLISRLQQGLKLARLYPNAPIIVTGGNQKDGVTEAYAMSAWLSNRRVSRKRLFLEDQAKDTVGNAVFSSLILRSLGATQVTLVTSSNHVRRGLVDFQEACLQRGLKLEYDTLGASAKGDKVTDKEQERVGVYRDLMRASGLWAFPGLHQ